MTWIPAIIIANGERATLQWTLSHGVSNHRLLDCVFRLTKKKISKLSVTGSLLMLSRLPLKMCQQCGHRFHAIKPDWMRWWVREWLSEHEPQEIYPFLRCVPSPGMQTTCQSADPPKWAAFVGAVQWCATDWTAPRFETHRGCWCSDATFTYRMNLLAT